MTMPSKKLANMVEGPAERISRTRERLLHDGVILCIRMGAGDPVLDKCEAAARGGLRTLEVTLTTPNALDIIGTLAQREEMLVGAGTVLSRQAVRSVARAGGKFVLSPVFDSAVCDEARRVGLLAIPGTGTPTEILAAHRAGASLVKVFPAGPLGGPAFLRAVRGPLPDVPLIPTSGPTSETIADYVAAGAVAVGVGAEVFPPNSTLDSIEQAARRVRDAMDRARA
ncbi:MAG: bifunctional 4-hydroxy-2-oxoglutarate aldolase/2-dehydro-3-deoxy-phosphogluconate aldolase [Gemmatimonadales bacterium]|nr:bifunctional 4-hydroxy-2-oxoglutarate aldolase/2-dehydro-3-deoxy-phosphogluconate aldolase [Gemmatimonadales bacterium]